MLLEKGYDDGKEYGESTRNAYKSLYQDAWEYDIDESYDLLKDINYSFRLEKMCRCGIREGIVYSLKQLGIDVDESDDKAIWKEVSFLLKKQGIEPESMRKVIKNWIATGKVGDRREDRINMYNLCWALELDVEHTQDFFFRRFFTIPFNYKDGTDAVYYYCIKNRKSYSFVDEFLKVVKDLHDTVVVNEYTIQVKRQIDEIDDDEEFKEYLKSNCFSEKMQMQSARRTIRELYDEIAISSVGELLTRMYGYSIQSTARHTKKIYGKSIGISKGQLPELFTKSLPNDTQMAEILNNERATYESLRKAVILLKFYSFYSSFDYEKDADELQSIDLRTEIKTNEEISEELNDFYMETNNMLYTAGYNQLYVKNPFDWIILFCAYTSNPLATFRDFITQAYINNVEEIK